MKKTDIILIVTILVIAFSLLGIVSFANKEDAYRVVVTVDGELYNEFSLGEEKSIYINETNLLVIDNYTATVKWADCPNQICVNHKDINQVGESIICLPNRVIINIKGD